MIVQRQFATATLCLAGLFAWGGPTAAAHGGSFHAGIKQAGCEHGHGKEAHSPGKASQEKGKACGEQVGSKPHHHKHHHHKHKHHGTETCGEKHGPVVHGQHFERGMKHAAGGCKGDDGPKGEKGGDKGKGAGGKPPHHKHHHAKKGNGKFCGGDDDGPKAVKNGGGKGKKGGEMERGCKQVGHEHPKQHKHANDCGAKGGKGKGGPAKGHGNNGVGNGVDPQPPGHPPINDGPGAGPGHPGNHGGPFGHAKGGPPSKGNHPLAGGAHAGKVKKK